VIWTTLVAEFRREWIQLKRYPTELLSEVIVIVAVFYGLFLGATYIAGNNILGSRMDSVIVGYMLWTLVLIAVNSMGYAISTESQNGTLEQVFLSPLGPITVLLLRNLAALVFNVVFTVLVILLIMMVTGRHLSLSVWEFVPLVMAVGSAIGIGYLVASITILFKRVNQLLGLLQFLLLFLVMSPFNDLKGAWHYIAAVIPFAPMVGLLQRMMIQHTGLLENPSWLLWGWANLAFWLALGMIVFHLACRKARMKGVLGHY
jgi:ABC-2 type transport system permease protein